MCLTVSLGEAIDNDNAQGLGKEHVMGRMLVVLSTMALLAGHPVAAQVAVAPRISTLGLGADVVVGLAEGLNARIGANWADLDLDHTFSDISYNANLDFHSYTAMLDWHVFGGSFRLTGGIVWNENEAKLDATPQGTIDIGGTEYPAADVVRLTAKAAYDQELAPYAGIGWGNAIGEKGRLGLLFDLGVAFTGAPKASLSASGPISSDPTFQQSLQQEQDQLNDDLDSFKFYPIIALSLFWRF